MRSRLTRPLRVNEGQTNTTPQVICGSDVGEPGAKPDTYVTLECDSNGVLCKKTKTKVVKASTTPNFDEVINQPHTRRN